MNEVSIGVSVHHVLVLPADEDNETQAVVCEAALVTRIESKQEGVVSVRVFPDGSEILEARNIAHSLALQDSTWHFIGECPAPS